MIREIIAIQKALKWFEKERIWIVATVLSPMLNMFRMINDESVILCVIIKSAIAAEKVQHIT